MDDVVKLLVTLMAYYYYNWYFFKYMEIILEIPQVKTRYILAAFAVNYVVFFLCSILNFHLIVNWCIFCCFLLAEVNLVHRGYPLENATSALSGALVGLAFNIFFRDALAVFMNVLLSAFDSHTSDPGNIKHYPIVIGFAVSGLLFHLASRRGGQSMMRDILKDRLNLHFLFVLMTVMYAYLCLNLLVYYAPGNFLVLKLWGIKSSVIVIIGCYLAMVFAHRMTQLEQYRIQNSKAKQILAMERQKEQDLRSIAYLDPLTGCYNRQRAREVLAEALQNKLKFCLCFLDLNDLKTINDTLGHAQGNEYLLTVVRHLRLHCRKGRDQLFRYGGDEFILLFFDPEQSLLEQRMQQVQQGLAAESHSEKYPYSMSISLGFVTGEGFQDIDELIQEADKQMYQQKLKQKTCASNDKPGDVHDLPFS